MSAEPPPDEIREPRPRRLLLVGLCIVAAAAVLVTTGIRGRARTEQDLARRTAEQAPPTVALIRPQRGAPAQELVLPGDIHAFALAPIYARASGYVKAWYKDIGARVSKGDVLAEIDTPDLDQQYAQAKADVANAAATAALAAATAQRYHALAAKNVISKQSEEEKAGDATARQAALESARANLARLQALMTFKSLVAPFDGIVTTRSIDVGTLINAGGTTGTALFQVADVHAMRVYVRVPQAFVAELRPGLKATLRLPQYPDQTFDATLVGSSNAITPESRTALVQLQADNPNGKLWPGTYAEVHFHLDPNPDALRVPATALMFGERGVRIATLDDNGTVVLKPVKLGHDIGSDIEILAGLDPSDRLIDSPLETLNTGDRVRVVDDGKATEDRVGLADGAAGRRD
jgi:RND family efflux transporter MFP subunit